MFQTSKITLDRICRRCAVALENLPCDLFKVPPIRHANKLQDSIIKIFLSISKSATQKQNQKRLLDRTDMSLGSRRRLQIFRAFN